MTAIDHFLKNRSSYFDEPPKVTDEELAQVNLKPAKFHGNWNYQILPGRKKK